MKADDSMENMEYNNMRCAARQYFGSKDLQHKKMCDGIYYIKTAEKTGFIIDTNYFDNSFDDYIRPVKLREHQVINTYAIFDTEYLCMLVYWCCNFIMGKQYIQILTGSNRVEVNNRYANTYILLVKLGIQSNLYDYKKFPKPNMVWYKYNKKNNSSCNIYEGVR